MPLYNAELHIRQSLECLLRQTHSDFEIIISDNQSTDRTLDIVRDYAARDNRIKIFQQSENIGPVPNFKFVLEQAAGEYFMWRSYDDWSDDNYLEKLAELLNTHDNIDLAIPNVFQFNNHDSDIRPVRSKLSDKIRSGSFIGALNTLKVSHPAWIYGLFRKEVAMNSMDEISTKYPHVWGWDHLALFPTLSVNRVGKCENTCFYQREADISSTRYRPKSPREQIILAKDFYSYCYQKYVHSNAGFISKLIMAVYIIKHTSAKTEKFSRIIRTLMKLRKPK